MFKQPIPLSADTHRDLRFSPHQPFDFARELVFIPLAASELFKAARETVIVFPIQGGVPQALVAFEAGCNVHIDDAGHWVGRYVPAHLRRYPFVLGEIPTTPEEREENGRRFGLQVDVGAPHLNKPDGIRLFDDTGQPTDSLKKIQQILMGLQHDFERTQAMVNQLDTFDLLEERQLKINPDKEESKVMTGFRLVDQKALADLPGDRLALLRETGALGMAYAHIMSLTNLEDGWLARQAGKSPVPDVPDIEKLFGESGSDPIQFG